MNISGHLIIEDLLVETLMKVLKFKFSLILREVHAVLSLILRKVILKTLLIITQSASLML